jgi:hypothetical protein
MRGDVTRRLVPAICAAAELFAASSAFPSSFHYPVSHDLAEHLAAEGAKYPLKGMAYDHRDGEFLVVSKPGSSGMQLGGSL